MEICRKSERNKRTGFPLCMGSLTPGNDRGQESFLSVIPSESRNPVLKIFGFCMAIWLLLSVFTTYGHTETERLGKPEIVTAKKAKKDDMKQLLKDAKKAFTDADQQAVIVKIIKELGGTE
ncbi:MAG: hypothetical protein HQK88_15885 [Nitrospirae bacterium]|nr:hypothetical protein [Nitrospirota bacterium]MBF0536340.1 hypothetical protein [Nitrospirota bacterium]MBF0618281.1 hypothetical protein [Nitrospirota bacterium]